jgi:hypothetical protein
MKMEPQITEEQEICLSCGICCDGTLYNKANLYPGEKGTLPEEIENSYFKIENAEYFRLPCSYFFDKCTIYNLKKAMVCNGFKCKLLGLFSKEKILKIDALKIVNNVKEFRKEIADLAYIKCNIHKGRSFKILQAEISEIKESQSAFNPDIEIIIGKCLILEILLTKYFLSQIDFDKMIINPASEELINI